MARVTLNCRIDGASDHYVTIDGWPLTPHRSLELRNHSPTGFAWGYHGSGPAQLALALLLETGLPKAWVERLYQPFKRQVIAILRQPAFTLPGAFVLGWISGHSRRLRAEGENLPEMPWEQEYLDSVRSRTP